MAEERISELDISMATSKTEKQRKNDWGWWAGGKDQNKISKKSDKTTKTTYV